ncbi:terminase family protein [bacterium]|nr:terminase family protein [bacterium]
MVSTALPKDRHEIARVLGDPVLWGQAYLHDRDGSRRVFWKHQAEDLRCERGNIIHLDGRDSGKSITLAGDVLHYAFTTRNGMGLVAAPHQGHLDTIIDEVEFQIGANPDLEASIAKNKNGTPKIKRSPYFRIEFTTGTVLHFRPAGPYGEASFRSLHVDRLWVDEGAWIPERAWNALRQCLNAGGKFRIYSTPNGLRDTTYYRLTETKKWKVFRWPSWINPTWTPEREAELVEFYGGKDTPGWQHEVAGEHGKPSFGAFDLDALHACRKEVPDYRLVVITSEELEGCEDEAAVRERFDMLVNLSPKTGAYWLGIDTGYTSDPTELVVFREDEFGLTMVLRVHGEQVPYPWLSELIRILDIYFEFAGIGLDNGGNGLAVAQELTSLDKFKDRHFLGRLMGFDFGGNTIVSFDTEGKPTKKRTKEHMTALINAALRRRLITFPRDDRQIEEQFATQTYTMTDGRVTYSKGRDHIIDAVRCALLAKDRKAFAAQGTHFEEVFLLPLATKPIF